MVWGFFFFPFLLGFVVMVESHDVSEPRPPRLKGKHHIPSFFHHHVLGNLNPSKRVLQMGLQDAVKEAWEGSVACH